MFPECAISWPISQNRAAAEEEEDEEGFVGRFSRAGGGPEGVCLGTCISCAHKGAADRTIARDVAIDLLKSIPFSLNLPKHRPFGISGITRTCFRYYRYNSLQMHVDLDTVHGWKFPPPTDFWARRSHSSDNISIRSNLAVAT